MNVFSDPLLPFLMPVATLCDSQYIRVVTHMLTADVTHNTVSEEVREVAGTNGGVQ